MFTDEEYEQMHEVKNDFWEAFSKLAAEHIAKMPERFQGELTMMLQDATSIYGSNYDEYLKELRK